MIQFDFEGVEYNMTTNWNEITLKQYSAIMKIQEKNSVVTLGEELLTQQLCEVLCGVYIGTFDEMSYGMITDLSVYLVSLIGDMTDFINKAKTFSLNKDSWIINGVMYSYHKDCNSYTLGDIADIKTLTINKKNEWDYIADIAAIIVRPAKMVKTEGGTSYIKLSKREPVDFITNREVVSGMLLSDITPVINFFLTGWISQNQTTQSYLKVRQVAM